MAHLDSFFHRLYSAVLGPRSGWKVEIAENGRCGAVYYRERQNSLRFYWEFGGGNVVAIIDVGTRSDWEREHPWAAPRRAEILQRVADEIIRQRAPHSKARLNETAGYLEIV